MMKSVSLVACLMALAFAEPAIAGSANAGTITQTVSFPSGQFLFYQNGSRVSPPACATFPGRWAVDVTTSGGQGAEANILTAFATARQVYVYGTGTCAVDPTSETVAYVTVNP
jgi:hypothetical protein